MKRAVKKSLTTDLSPHIAIFVLIFAALFIIFMVSCSAPDKKVKDSDTIPYIINNCDTIYIDTTIHETVDKIRYIPVMQIDSLFMSKRSYSLGKMNNCTKAGTVVHQQMALYKRDSTGEWIIIDINF